MNQFPEIVTATATQAANAGSGPAVQPAHRYAQDLQSPQGFLPFIQQSQIVHMGLNRLDTRRWIQPCTQLPHYQHNKLAARRKLGDRVFAQLPESLPAQQELASLLARHLVQDHPAYAISRHANLCWRTRNAALHWPGVAAAVASGQPLWDASLWVADDCCILQPGPQGYALVAASLAAPSYWRLEEKIGRPLDYIHGPVPGFRQRLAEQVSRFFDHLLPEYPVWRGNWSVVNSGELLQRGEDTGSDRPARESGAGLYLRVERQSLRRLPKTGAVVFTIRVMINPLSDLLAVAGAIPALKSAVDAMSPEETRYKSLAPIRQQLQQFFVDHCPD